MAKITPSLADIEFSLLSDADPPLVITFTLSSKLLMRAIMPPAAFFSFRVPGIFFFFKLKI